MKWISVVLAAILMSSSLWAGTVIDDFEDGNFDGWRPSRFALGEQAEWTVEQGELIFTAKNFCRVGSALGIGDETWNDYEFSVQFSLRRTFPICRIRNPNAEMMVGKSRGARSGYLLSIKEDRIEVVLQLNRESGIR